MRHDADKQRDTSLLQRGKSVTASHRFCGCPEILVRLILGGTFSPVQMALWLT